MIINSKYCKTNCSNSILINLIKITMDTKISHFKYNIKRNDLIILSL